LWVGYSHDWERGIEQQGSLADHSPSAIAQAKKNGAILSLSIDMGDFNFYFQFLLFSSHPVISCM
jgi:hypothetical protein